MILSQPRKAYELPSERRKQVCDCGQKFTTGMNRVD